MIGWRKRSKKERRKIIMAKKEKEPVIKVDWYKLIGLLGGLLVGIILTWYFLTH